MDATTWNIRWAQFFTRPVARSATSAFLRKEIASPFSITRTDGIRAVPYASRTWLERKLRFRQDGIGKAVWRGLREATNYGSLAWRAEPAIAPYGRQVCRGSSAECLPCPAVLPCKTLLRTDGFWPPLTMSGWPWSGAAKTNRCGTFPGTTGASPKIFRRTGSGYCLKRAHRARSQSEI